MWPRDECHLWKVVAVAGVQLAVAAVVAGMQLVVAAVVVAIVALEGLAVVFVVVAVVATIVALVVVAVAVIIVAVVVVTVAVVGGCCDVHLHLLQQQLVSSLQRQVLLVQSLVFLVWKLRSFFVEALR